MPQFLSEVVYPNNNKTNDSMLRVSNYFAGGIHLHKSDVQLLQVDVSISITLGIFCKYNKNK